MSYFACIFRPSGGALAAQDRDRLGALIAGKGLRQAEWHGSGCFTAMAVGTALESSPTVVSTGSQCIVGTARLDNREELSRRVAVPTAASDLEVVARCMRQRGAKSLREMVGDFGFVCWDHRNRTLTAARDAMGVNHLYWSQLDDDLTALSSHASLLAEDDSCNLEYIARTFARADRSEHTIYGRVRPLAAACSLRIRDERLIIERYWSPHDLTVGASEGRTEIDCCEEFKELFFTAVRSCMSGNGKVWAELSGGLDTSSIIMTSALLHRRGVLPDEIAGTITHADSLAGGDESEYVHAVSVASGLPNHELKDYWPWQADGCRPPETESPGPMTAFWARERQRDRLLREAGAGVLLGGGGGDFVVGGSAFFFADWVAQGHLLKALRELIRWSVIRRQSFWRFAFANAVAPLLPSVLRARCVTRDDPIIPIWVRADFRKRYAMDDLLRSRRVGGVSGRGRSRYYEVLGNRLLAVASAHPQGHPSVEYERRYPFLNRPLAEFPFRVPPEILIRGRGRKWVLREAMRGVLPEMVRTRRTKGSAQSRMLWALQHERQLIEWMLREPILAQMGCVEPATLREVYRRARRGSAEPEATLPIFRALHLETWLRIRSGRWPIRDGSRSSSSAKETTTATGVTS